MTILAGDEARQPSSRSRPTLRSRTHAGPLAVAVLVMIPVLTFSVSALAGHPFLSVDDLIQNFPLRILVARNLNQGHLPLWNPYIWSGTALLAGLNAGAFYPATLLFAVLSSEAAWVVNEILVYAVASIGLYVFLRRSKLSVPASFLGSLSFTAGGFMTAQLAHIDLVQAASLVPWMLVALQRMASAREATTPAGRRPMWPVVVLGAGFSLLILSGSPEALIDDSILVIVYGGWLAWRHRSSRIVVQMVIAGASALVLTAIQWLPGLVFASQSQRSASSYAFFTSGSFPPKLTALTAMPYLLGGYGRFGVPIYHGQYNLAEVSTYVGILPVCAAFVMLTRPWKALRASEGLAVWYLLIVVGLLLSFGGYTPLGHLLVHLPIYGQQRLQNRNMITVDIGLAILFAYWVDGVRHRLAAGRDPDRPTRAERTWAVLPVVCLIAIVAALVASPVVISQELGSPVPLGSFRHLEVYLAVGLAIAVAAGLLAAGWDRLPRRYLLRGVMALVAVDLLVYCANQYWLTPPPRSALTDTTGMANAVAAQTGHSGRFAIYDPDLSDPVALNDLGQPDLNVLRKLSSVQGYGSLVNGDYDAATGSHQQSTLSPAGLAGSTFDDLNLTTLVTRPGYFTQPPGSTSTPRGPVPETVPVGGQRSWYVGRPLPLTGVTAQLHPDPTCVAPPGGLSVGLLTPDGRSEAGPPLLPSAGSSASAGAALDGAAAIGIVVTNSSGCPVTVDSATVASSAGKLLLAGPLQGAVTAPKWQFVRTLGSFVVFRNTAARGRFWIEPADGGPAPAATLRVGDDPITGNQSVEVSTPRPSRVVRSVAAAPGWTATVRPQPTGPSREIAVPAGGSLVQSVPVPAGTSTVTWRYRPASVTVGAATSLAGAAALGTLGLALLLRGPLRRALARRRSARSGGDG